MTSLFNRRKTTYICYRCDEDPLESAKLKKLMQAVKPPKGFPKDPLSN
jgi:hypothetical protein